MSVGETVGARESLLRTSESHRGSQLENMRRKLTSSSLGDDDGGGLGDPFAEIFARIATSEAPPAPAEVAAPESSADEDTEASHESDQVEESDSQEASQPSAEIAPVKTDEPILSTDTEAVETTDEEVVVNETNVDESLTGDDDEPTEEAGLEQNEVESTATIQESSETSTQNEVVTPEASVDQDVVVSALQKKRSDEGENETEATANTSVQGESEETDVRITSTTAKTNSDANEEQRHSNERSAAVAANSEDGVERRRYSKGQDKPGAQDDPASSHETAGEAQPVNGREQESRSSQSAASHRGIDISSLTPVSSNASASVPVTAAIGALGSNSATNAAAKPTSVGSSAANSSVTAPAKGIDATGSTGSPIDSPASNQRSSPTGPEKSGVKGTDTLSAVQRAKLIQRVSRGFQQIGSNGGQIRMRLAPDQLGSVQLQMKLQNGELSGTMLTQTDAATQALREQLPQLRSSLESQGIRLDRMDIQTEAAANAQDASTSDGRFSDASGQSGRGFDQRGQLADQRERSSWSDVRATPRGKPEAAPENPARMVSSVPTGAVDLKA